MSEHSEAPMRRVRPWIAALLTLLSWGLGLYYARRTRAAVRMAMAQVFFALALGVSALLILLRGPADMSRYFNPDELSLIDAIHWGLTFIVAVVVWRIAAQEQSVPRAGPGRLFGYVAIWLGPILISLILALSLRFLAWHPFRNPSASMAPTLHVGETFIVEKWAYGYSRYSFAPLEGLLPRGRWLARAPQRGDVIVFRPLHEPNRDFVKRIAGIPGDRVQMIAGALYINGQAVTREDLGERAFSHDAVRAYRETLPNGASYTIFDHGDGAELDNTRAVTVPDGHYFVLGDNRDFSDDSRRSVGFVPLENIVGRAVTRPTAP